MGLIMKNGVPYAQGNEIPQGGTKGQVLAKASNLDGDMEWKDEEGGGGGETPTLDAVLKKGNTTESSARFTDELNGRQVEVGAGGTYMTGNGTEGMRQFSVNQNGISAIDNLVGTITPKFVVPFEPSGEDQVAMSDAVKESFKKALDTNAKITFDNEYNYLQIRDGNGTDIGFSQDTANTVRIQEYAKDDRGQVRPIFDETLPNKAYVDDKVNFRFIETNNGGVVTYNMTFAELKAMYDAKKQGMLVGSGQNVFPFLSFNYYNSSSVGGERIQFKTRSNSSQVRVFTVLPDDTVTYEFVNEGGINIEVGVEKWQGTYTDENGETFQVYSKMVYIPALPSEAGITKYEHGVSNIKQILNIYGFTTDGFVLNAPRQTATDNITIYQASKSESNKTFSIEVGKDRSSKKAYVVMVYAKNN